MDVLLQELAVVVDERGNGVLGEDPVPDLTLHGAEELVGNLFLQVTHAKNRTRRKS